MAIIIKKGKAADQPRPAPVVEGAETAKVVQQKQYVSPQWEQYLKDNPKKAAQYAEAQKRPREERAVVCTGCGNAYVLPCIDDEDRSKCMSWQWRQEAKAKGIHVKKAELD